MQSPQRSVLQLTWPCSCPTGPRELGLYTQHPPVTGWVAPRKAVCPWAKQLFAEEVNQDAAL